MKVFFHCRERDLFEISKLCLAMVDVNVIKSNQIKDLIYSCNQEFNNSVPIIYYNTKDEEIETEAMIVFRRMSFLVACSRDSKDCGCAHNMSIDDLKDIIFTKKYSILTDRIIPREVEFSSGFGHYVRSIIRQFIIKAETENKNVILHGSEAETVIMKLFDDEECINKIDVRGMPRMLDQDEFIRNCDRLKVITNPVLDKLKCKISDVTLDNYPKLTPDVEYESMSAINSYEKYRVKYPDLEGIEDQDRKIKSLDVGFKYSTFIHFMPYLSMILIDGVVCMDVGAGILAKFLKDAGIKVSIPVWEDISYLSPDELEVRELVGHTYYKNCIMDPLWEDLKGKTLNSIVTDLYIKSKGYVNKYVFMPMDIADKDGRFVLKVKGLSVGLYQIDLGYKVIYNIEEFMTRQFRTYLCRAHIKYEDMFKVKYSENDILIAMLSASNKINSGFFTKAIKHTAFDFKCKYLIMYISAEAYAYATGADIQKGRLSINESGHDEGIDTVYYNTELIKIKRDWYGYQIPIDTISLKDLEVMMFPYKYVPKWNIHYDITDSRSRYFGFMTNAFNMSFQNVITSPTMMNKSASTKLKIDNELSENALHKIRFDYLVGKHSKFKDLHYKTREMWSLCYYMDPKTKEKRFLDVSGHMINLIICSTMGIRNWGMYSRQKISNLKEVQIEGYSEFSAFIKHYKSGEDRSKKGIWHTNTEDYDGVSVAGIIIKKFKLQPINLKPIFELVMSWPYQNHRLSVTVIHDKELK